MLVALEPQCAEIADCVFEGRDQEDIGAGDQVGLKLLSPTWTMPFGFAILTGLIDGLPTKGGLPVW